MKHAIRVGNCERCEIVWDSKALTYDVTYCAAHGGQQQQERKAA